MLMDWSASVLTSLSSDTEPSIVVTFESGKYIFNMGENTARAALQSKRGWKKVKGLFVTEVGTKRTSGLSGMIPFRNGAQCIAVVCVISLIRFN